MPFEYYTVGTGLTRRQGWRLQMDAPLSAEDEQALADALSAAAAHGTFEGLLATMEPWAKGKLVEAGLPDIPRLVHIRSDGQWVDDLPDTWDPHRYFTRL